MNQIKKVFENKIDHKNNKNRIKTALTQDKISNFYIQYQNQDQDQKNEPKGQSKNSIRM